MSHTKRVGGIWQGQSVVEFGLVSLLFLTMVVGTADLGRAVFQRQELSNAVREGARFAMVDEEAREGDTLVSEIASAASQRSPSLGLSATSFQSPAGGEVTCKAWANGARVVPQHYGAMPLLLGSGLVALGAPAAKKPTATPTPTHTPGSTEPTATNTPSGGGEEDEGGWTVIACSSAEPGDRLTICAGYTFRPVSMAILRLGPITMTDCSTVTIQ